MVLCLLISSAASACLGRSTPFSSLQFWGVFGAYLMLLVFGRNTTSVSADSPWKLLYHFAVSGEVRWAARVSAMNSNSVLSLQGHFNALV